MPLVDKSVWSGKRRVGLVDEIEWVRQHLAVANVYATDSPSAAAWSMLWDARSSPEGYSAFMEKYATKLIPSRRELDDKLAQQDVHTKLDWIEYAINAAVMARSEAKSRQDAMDRQYHERQLEAAEKRRETRHQNKMRRLQEEGNAAGN
jgi:ATPase subunit of ABC transporter with duplicated ATPase domains